MRRRENPVHHHGAQQPEPAAVDRIQARTQVDSAALSRPPDLDRTMKPFATLAPAERALVINEAAGRLGLVPLIVEKDFWVCWTLARIFETPALVPHLVFKGGTSLSKVFGGDPALLRGHRSGRVCAGPGFHGSGTRRSSFGQPTSQAGCRRSRPNASGACPIAFHQRSNQPSQPDWVLRNRQAVGCATNSMPWPARQTCCSLTLRHWARLAATSPKARLDQLEDVVRHKSRFFASGWTHYESARPGTDPQARATARTPPGTRAGLCKDGTDVHGGAHCIRRRAAATGSCGAAPQRWEQAVADANNLNAMMDAGEGGTLGVRQGVDLQSYRR